MNQWSRKASEDIKIIVKNKNNEKKLSFSGTIVVCKLRNIHDWTNQIRVFAIHHRYRVKSYRKSVNFGEELLF